MTQTLNSLQIGRGLAAMAVVVSHAAQSANAFSEGVPQIPKSIAEEGYLGVDFFFVLSGFIIFYTAGASTDLVIFFKKRLRRIFVPYLPIGLGLALIYLIAPNLSAGNREWSWLATLTLLPANSPPALSVAWTLQHEMLFYSIFALGFIFARKELLIYIWSAICLMMFLFSDPPEEKSLRILFGPINLEFLFGLLAAKYVLSDRLINPIYLYALSAVVIATFFLLPGLDRSTSFVFGAGIALAVGALAKKEISTALPSSRFLVFLGAASYSIYLLHNPIISITSRLLQDTSWYVVALGGIVAGSLAGIAYHLIWEKKVLALLSSRDRKQSKVKSLAGA